MALPGLFNIFIQFYIAYLLTPKVILFPSYIFQYKESNKESSTQLPQNYQESTRSVPGKYMESIGTVLVKSITCIWKLFKNTWRGPGQCQENNPKTSEGIWKVA